MSEKAGQESRDLCTARTRKNSPTLRSGSAQCRQVNRRGSRAYPLSLEPNSNRREPAVSSRAAAIAISILESHSATNKSILLIPTSSEFPPLSGIGWSDQLFWKTDRAWMGLAAGANSSRAARKTSEGGPRRGHELAGAFSSARFFKIRLNVRPSRNAVAGISGGAPEVIAG